jgi:hypothetical protein
MYPLKHRNEAFYIFAILRISESRSSESTSAQEAFSVFGSSPKNESESQRKHNRASYTLNIMTSNVSFEA